METMDLQSLLGEDLAVEAKIEDELKNINVHREEKVEEKMSNNTVDKNVATEVKSVEMPDDTFVDIDEDKNINLNVVESDNNTSIKYDQDIIPPFDDEYLKDLDYTWIIRDGNYFIQKSNGKLLEQRNKYWYLAPTLLEKAGFKIVNFEYVNGGSYVCVAQFKDKTIIVNESITGYYPAVLTMISPAGASTVKIKHSKKFVVDIISLLTQTQGVDK